MKRLLKFLVNFLFALIAVALTFLLIFLVTPSWQKRVVEEALAQDSARTWQFESVQIRPHTIEMENVFMLDGDVGAGIEFLQIDGPFWKLVVLGELQVQSGSVIGLALDVSKVDIGDVTSRTYQDFLDRVSGDLDFWKERVALVLSKVAASGVRVELENVQINGHVLMPGDKVIPVRWVIRQADSRAPGLIDLEPLSVQNSL